MKYVSLIPLVVFVGAQCHVIVENQTKGDDRPGVTDGPNKDNFDAKELKKQPIVKTVLSDEKRVYLEDVLYNLRNQNWTMEEAPCFNQTLRMLKGLQNFTLWAVWEWDSIASEPSGLLFGNLYQLGNFDECLGAPWAKTHPELQTKYCLTKVRLERTDKAMKRRTNGPFDPYSSALDFIQDVPLHARPLNELTWGACVPASCGPVSIKRLLAVMMARSHLGTAGIVPHITVEGKCQRSDEPMQRDGLFYAFMALTLVLLAISVICTCWNSWKGESSRCAVIKAFCLRENAADLLNMRKDGIEILYGVRFITICLIVVDHQFGFVNSGAVSDGRVIDKTTLTPAAMMFLHDDLFVDTFFFLSGFLVIINLMAMKKNPNPLLIILKRYLRIAVCFAVLIFFMSAVLPHIGDGPLWPAVAEAESEACRQNWWLSLLMLNNYINADNMCMVVSWYIPCDFHFFVVTVLLFWLYKKIPKLAKVCGGFIAVASIVVPGVIIYYHDLPGLQLFTYEFLINPRASKQFQLAYIKSHMRMAAYIVGVLGGCIFLRYKNSNNVQRLNLKWSLAGVTLGLTVMVLIMFSGWTFMFGDHRPVENALYAALNRPIWSAGLMLLVLCCCLGHVPMVKGFLSWYPWVPLSRLSYGLYLTHLVLVIRNVYVTRNPGHYNYMQMISESLGFIFWGCIFAFAIWLLAEAPANRLLMILLKPRIAKGPAKIEEAVSTQGTSNLVFCGTSTDSLAAERKGQLHSNMPATIQFSSKI